MAVRRTGTYRYSGSDLVANVRVPQITNPDAGNDRITLTPMGFRKSCCESVVSANSPTAPATLASVPAGAFQTPRLASIRAYIPATKPEGGACSGVGDTPVGSFI